VVRPCAALAFALAFIVAAVAPARAEEPAPAAPVIQAPASDPLDEATEQARAHHRRGLELYDEGDFRLALVEFERAYSVGHSFKVLFNIGQVHFQLYNYAKARLALEQYLREGGAAINEQRRAIVEKDLATLRARTATLTVRVSVGDADVLINQALVGKAPLDNLMVDAGTLHLQITRRGYAPTLREITLAGGEQQVMTIDLVETPSNVLVTQVSTGLPGAAVAGWIITGALLAGTIGTGIAATSEKSTYDTKRSAPIPGSVEEGRADLERQRNLVSALALTTDILAVAALAAGGISLYLTLRERPRPDAAHVRANGAGATFQVGF